MSKNRRAYEYIGQFTTTQPKILVSDPGYDKDEYCSRLVDNCKTGQWDAYINKNHYTFEYEKGLFNKDCRVASVFVKHNSATKELFGTIHLEEKDEDSAFFRWRGNWVRLSDNIGVDSGQAGFFDYDKFGDNSQFDAMGQCGFGDKWYSNCCDATLGIGKYAGIIAKCGVNSSSGFGDGCYTVWGHKTKDNKIDAMVLFFLADNESIEL